MKSKNENDPATIIAEELTKISAGMTKMLSAGLRRKTVAVLLHHATKCSMRDIEAILTGLEDLAADWTTKLAAPKDAR